MFIIFITQFSTPCFHTRDGKLSNVIYSKWYLCGIGRCCPQPFIFSAEKIIDNARFAKTTPLLCDFNLYNENIRNKKIYYYYKKNRSGGIQCGANSLDIQSVLNVCSRRLFLSLYYSSLYIVYILSLLQINRY